MRSLALVALVVFGASGEQSAAVAVVPRALSEMLPKARAEARDVLGQKRADFAACVEKKLPFVAAAEQQIDFALDVRDDGTPSLASVTMSTLGNNAVENCLLAVMRSLRFSFGRAQLRISLPVAVNMPPRDDATPRVELKLTSHGSLSPAQAEETIDKADFKACAVVKNYAVQLKLQVEASGAVSHAELRADAAVQRDGAIDACLLDVARHMRFATIEHGVGAAVYAPLIFQSAAPASQPRASATKKSPPGCHALALRFSN